jgi:MFS family permease
MSFYAIAAFGGPVVGPIAGSFLAEATSWRWLFWLLVIFAGISFLAGTS